jgi:hypothetical protein
MKHAFFLNQNQCLTPNKIEAKKEHHYSGLP